MTTDKKPEFLPYQEFEKEVREAGVKTAKEYQEWKNKSGDTVPSNPPQFYKDKGWTSWEDFLGN